MRATPPWWAPTATGPRPSRACPRATAPPKAASSSSASSPRRFISSTPRPGWPSLVADLDLLVLGDVNPDLVLADATMEVPFGQAETLVDDAELTIGGSGAIMA